MICQKIGPKRTSAWLWLALLLGVGTASGCSLLGQAREPADCPAPVTPVPLPATSLPNFRFPAGMTVTSVQTGAQGLDIDIHGVSQSEYRQTLNRIVIALQRAGYRLVSQEAEMVESDAVFLGHHVSGRVMTSQIPGCEGRSTFVVNLLTTE